MGLPKGTRRFVVAGLGVLGCSAANVHRPEEPAAWAPQPAPVSVVVTDALPGSAPAELGRGLPAEPGWLGVALAGRSPEEPGVIVSSVLRRSPADVHGLRVGDVVLGVDDERVNTPEQLSRLIADSGAGARANLMVLRQDQHHLLAVRLAQNPGLEGQLRLGFVDATAPELEGVEVARGDVGPTLRALRGQVVVLEFWATWCGACRALLPTLNSWHERYRARGALVLSVTTDPVAKAAQDAAELGLMYPVLSDPDSATAQEYQAFALPTLFIIDRAGVVRDVSVGYDPARISELEATIERLVSDI